MVLYSLFDPAAAVHPSSQAPPAGHLVYNGAVGKCLDADSGRYGLNGDNVHLWTCNSAKSEQLWHQVGTEIVNANGMCLDADHGHLGQDGDNVQLWTCTGSAGQKWYPRQFLLSDGRDVTAVVNGLWAGRQCLDADSNQIHRDGDNVQTWSCHVDRSEQQFSPLDPAPLQ